MSPKPSKPSTTTSNILKNPIKYVAANKMYNSPWAKDLEGGYKKSGGGGSGEKVMGVLERDISSSEERIYGCEREEGKGEVAV